MGLTSFHAQPVAAFKGRGSFVLLRREALGKQAEARKEMEELVGRSKISGSPLYLQKHVRNNGTWELRWRYRNGRHVLWDDAQATRDALPLAIRRHCEGLNQRARELYAIDSMLQHTVRWCESVVDHTSMH